MTWTRVAFLAALIIVALLLSRVLNRGGARVSEERAVDVSRQYVGFTPEGHNIRLIRRGIPPRPFWAVSWWIKDTKGAATRVTVVVVNADTGVVTEVRKSE